MNREPNCPSQVFTTYYLISFIVSNTGSAKPTVSRHNIHSGAKTSSDGPVSDHLSVKGQGGMDSKSDHPSVRKRKPLSSLTNTMPSPKQHKGMFTIVQCLYCVLSKLAQTLL